MKISLLKESNIKTARLISQGKVRDIYDAGEYLLFVASDRISAFDVIMKEPIPAKGIVLTQISKFWFERTVDIIDNHYITTDVSKYPDIFNEYREILRGRSMLVRRANPLPVECIVRGYVAGSAWKEYKRTGTIHESPASAGLRESDKLPEPIFTPSTKAVTGHDENITYQRMVDLIGSELSDKIKDISLQIFRKGMQISEERGIIIADTKFEFGLLDDKLILIDEVLTPDSSRFWPMELYEPGKSQPSLDKQYLRDYLESLNWDKNPPPPDLPEEIIQNTSKKYQEILRIFTGKTITDILNE